MGNSEGLALGAAFGYVLLVVGTLLSLGVGSPLVTNSTLYTIHHDYNVDDDTLYHLNALSH